MSSETPSHPPTEESPDTGRVTAFDVVLSEAEHWVEDSIHVIRSLEFDVVAGDPNFEAAVDQFGQKAEDLWTYLGETDRLTENENETFLLLSRRFHAVLRAYEQEEQRRRRRLISVSSRLRHGARTRQWQPLSTPSTSSQPSLV